jgi:N-acetylneuraminate synthase
MMKNDKTYIIAEAGVNHNGSAELAFNLLSAAVDCKADCIKFQTFNADLLCSRSNALADYQARNTHFMSQQEMLRALELPKEVHFDLMEEARIKKIDFLSTPFDLASLEFLTNQLGLKLIKISSGDLLNSPLLIMAAQSQVSVILSTGMARLGDIEIALASLAWGYTQKGYPRSKVEMLEILQDRNIYKILMEKVSILHCTSSYPADFEHVNLTAMSTLKQAFNLKTGYSDHTLGIEVAIAAVALGAKILEKHFTLNKSMEGPDHKASLSSQELGDMVTSIRHVEKALGLPFKYRVSTENEVFDKVQKKVLAVKNIKKGEIITLDNTIFKRHQTGKLAYEVWDLLGKPALREYVEEEPL